MIPGTAVVPTAGHLRFRRQVNEPLRVKLRAAAASLLLQVVGALVRQGDECGAENMPLGVAFTEPNEVQQ
jgi:hypothetical protein